MAAMTVKDLARLGSLCILSEAPINITQRFGGHQPITYKWLLGDFWTLLAQCC